MTPLFPIFLSALPLFSLASPLLSTRTDSSGCSTTASDDVYEYDVAYLNGIMQFDGEETHSKRSDVWGSPTSSNTSAIGRGHLAKRDRSNTFWDYLPVIEINVGSPPQKVNVLVDTGARSIVVPIPPPGSSRFRKFDPRLSKTFHNIGTPFQIEYEDSCTMTGATVKDFISVGYQWAARQEFGIVATPRSQQRLSRNMYWSGSLGLGYRDPESSVTRSFIENLHSQDVLNDDQRFFTLAFSESTRWKGIIKFGELDKSLFKGPLLYYPIVPYPSTNRGLSQWMLWSDGFFLNADRITGGFTVMFVTGSIMPWATSNVMEGLISALLPNDEATLSNSRYLFPGDIRLGELSISLGGNMYPLDPNVVDLGEADTDRTKHVLGIYETKSLTRHGPAVILGAAVLKDYFMVFDAGKKQIGLAKSK
ncbi:hypothetical protein FRB99_000846 [Tulasnella sp. 403]|nr:hypothetical protein FRB99_000846 [Tulasnella sp. 403]